MKDYSWVRVPGEVIDPFDNTVTVNLDHFSIYQVSVVDNYTADIASYKNLGLAPYLQYFKNHQEYVAPGSGSLNIQAVDLYLPGRNGLDISIVRAYSSARAVLRTLTAHEGRNRYPGFGNGWTLNLPHVELTQHGEVVYLEEGSGYYLDWEEKTTDEDGQLYETIYKEGLFFQARKKVIKTADVHFNGETIEEIWENVWIEIYLNDGKSYYFDENGAIVRITDRTEANTITFAYHDDRIVIEDTLGRNVVINYNRDHLVTSIVSDVYEVTYQYYTGQEGQPRNALAKVTQQGQWETVYHYEQDNVRDGSVYTYDIPGEDEPVVVESITDNPVWVIASVQYPSGGSSHYTYENRWRRADATITGIAGIYEGRLVTDVTCQYSEIIWTDLLVKTQQNQTGDATANRMNFTYEISQTDGITKTTSVKDQFKTEQEFANGVPVAEKQYDLTEADSDIPEYTISNTYDAETKLLKTKTFYRDNLELYKQEYKYDDWGNVVWEKNSANGAEVYYQYLNAIKPDDLTYPRQMTFLEGDQSSVNPRIHNLLRGQYMANRNPLDGAVTDVKSSFLYDVTGNPTHSAVWDSTASDWAVTRFVYADNDGDSSDDQYGLVKGIIGPYYLNSGTGDDTSYTKIDYGYKESYPVKVTKGKYLADHFEPGEWQDVLGQPVAPIVLWTGYDFFSGQKLWETDGEGNLSEYAYDYLGRLTVIRYPDEDDEVAVSLDTVTNVIADGQGGSNTVSYQAPVLTSSRNLGNNPVKIQYYNDQLNQTTVTNAYTLSALADPAQANTGSLYMDSPLHMLQGVGTSASGLLVKINKLGLDVHEQVANPVAAGTENQALSGVIFNKTRYQYDELGRLIEVHQYLKPEELDAGQQSPFITRLVYDEYGNIIKEIDAENRYTYKEYDCFGRVKAIYYPETVGDYASGAAHPAQNYQMKTTIEYIDWQNLRRVTDAENRVVEEKKDWLGNVIEVNRLGSQTYQYRARYDQQNNLVEAVTPAGSTVMHYDSRSLLTCKELPEVEFIRPGEVNISRARPQLAWQYDVCGNKLKEYTANGVLVNGAGVRLDDTYATSYQYDVLGRPVAVAGPAGSEVLNLYDAKSQVVKTMVKVEELTNGTTLINDPTIFNNSLYRVQEAVYHPQGWELANIVWEKENDAPYKLITCTQYDLIGKPVAVTDPHGVVPEGAEEAAIWTRLTLQGENYALSPHFTSSVAYDSLGRKILQTGPLPHASEIADILQEVAAGKLTADPAMTALEQSRARYTYDKVGNLKSETYYKLTYTDANIFTGRATEAALFSKTYGYYPQNWLQHARLNGKLQVTYEYDRTGNQRKVSTYVDDSTQNTVQYEYDSFGRIATIIQPDGARTFRQYDALDNLTYECDNNWSIMRWEYDALGRLVKVDEPDVQADTYYRYDPDGNLVRKEMSNGYQISYNFNPRGQVTEEHQLTNGELLVDYYGYYAGGDLKYKINPRGIKEEYSYNLRGLPALVTYHTYGQTNYETAYWSAHGNKTASGDSIAADPTWQQKEWTAYTYNAVGSMLTSKMFEGTAAAWSQLNEVAMEYNSRNRVITLTRKIPDNLPEHPGDTVNLSTYNIRYHYDAAGNTTGMLYPNSTTWLKYEYNADNRLAKIPGYVEGTNTDGFSYDQSGRLTDIRYANQVNTHYELDSTGRIKDIQISGFKTDAANADSLNYHYTYDGVGNVMTRNQNKYNYDGLDRLTYV